MYRNLFEFYRSDEWETFRKIIIQERTREDGLIYDEETGKPILKRYDLILHHKIELTEENVHDATIALNPDNIEVVSFRTHNIIHDRIGYSTRSVFLVYGSPMSGKTTWVNENKTVGDLVVDIDNIWECVSGCERYVKPPRLRAVVFKIRDGLLDAVRYRLGKWQNCFLVGGYALQSERERLAKEMGAREVLIDTDKAECLARLERCEDGRDKVEWEKYINDWWEAFIPPQGMDTAL
jgi:hypothetical protein